MDKKNQQLAEQLGNLSWDNAPDAAHRNRLEADLLRAWTTRRESQQTVSRWRVLTRKGQAIMMSRTTRYSAVAAVIVAVVLGWTFLPRSSNPGGTAWALEQSIAALDGIQTVFITGVVDGPARPFRYRARHDPQTNQFRFRYEADKDLCVFDGTRGYAQRSGENQVVTFQPVVDLGVLKFTPESLTMQMWVRGQMLAMLKQTAQDWQEMLGRDEQTQRPCVFVTCGYGQQNSALSLWLQFDQQTKLPMRAKLWRNLKRQGTPAFEARQIVYGQPVSEEQFVSQPPAGASVVDSAEGLDLLAQGQKVFDEKSYNEAIAIYQQIIDKYPQWQGAEEAFMMVGLCYSWLGQHDKAVAALERATGEYTAWAAAWYYLAGEYQQQGRFEDALKAYIRTAQQAQQEGRADDAFPNPNARRHIAELQVQLFGQNIPDWANAIDVSAERRRMPQPDGTSQVDSQTAAADQLFQDHKYDQAVDAYQTVINAAPNTEMARQAQVMIGICYGHMNQPERAVDVLERVVHDYADVSGLPTPASYFYLADAYQQVDRKEDAIKACIQCVQLADRAGQHEGFPADSARNSIAALQLELFGQNIPDWANVIDVAAERERIAASQAAQSSPAQ